MFFGNEIVSNLQRPSQFIRLCVSVLIVIGFAFQCQTSFAAPAMILQATQESELEITTAREKANAAQKRFKTTKRLSEKGSASKKQVRVAELQRNLAVLELSTLLDPSRRQRNLTTASKLLLKYREDELVIVRQLYKRGSATEIAYRRAVVARDVAKSEVQALVSATETQRKLRTIEAAKSKYDLAKKEFSIAEKLYQSGSISQQDYGEFASKLKLATAEWESTKKSLGARATVVRQ